MLIFDNIGIGGAKGKTGTGILNLLDTLVGNIAWQ
jgi:hypothetical protein